MLSSCAVLFSLACSSSNDGPGTGTPQGGTSSGGTASGTAGMAGQSAPGGAGSGSGSTAGSGGQPVTTGGSANGGTAGGSLGGGGGGGGAGGGSGGGAGTPCGTGSIFCTDFEAEAIPEQLLYYPEYERASQKTITLDTTVFHGGKRALKVVGSSFSQMLGVAVPSKFWGRVYMRSDTDIQMGHNTYVAAGTGTGDPNDGTYIRIGEHQCQLELNRNTDDKELLSNGGMYMCEGGVKLLKDTWYCLEFLYDGPGQQTRVFVDNTEVTALHTTDWGMYDYKLFKLGFEKYHGAEKTLWYDDLAIAAEQLHCL